MTPAKFAVLAVLILFAGLVDALAGGGGLITLPAYLAAGLNPALILGTNKLASFIGTAAATANYQRSRRVPIWPFVPVIAASLAGSLLGARLTMHLDPRWIRYGLLVVMPLLAAFLYIHPHFGAEDRSARHSHSGLLARLMAVAMPIGAYDGFFGPGTGTFLALALSRICGYDLIASTSRAKILNLASNAAALAAFLWAGRVHLALGLSMGAMSVLGNVAGSHLGIKNGPKAIRPAILLVCAGLFLKLLFS